VRALALLLQAHHYAEVLGRDEWAFAVEIHSLRKFGLSNNDLRWLLHMEYVRHGTELTSSVDCSRVFRPGVNSRFSRRTCFILTDRGATFADEVCRHQAEAKPGDSYLAKAPVIPAGRPDTPAWDRDRRELRLGSALVKCYKVTAPNQEAILAAFEEEGWPTRIDDPLSRQINQDPKRRLHDTIVALNKHQKRRLIRFLGDGSGEGIRWELVDEECPAVGLPTESTTTRPYCESDRQAISGTRP
jgi:hypothetical protein